MEAAFNERERLNPPPHERRWTLKVTLISAQHLPDVRKLLKMKVYAQVSVNGEQPVNTEADTEGERNPRWNSSFEFERVMAQVSTLVVKLYCKRTMKRDRFVCKAEISMQELVQKWQCGDGQLVLDLHSEEAADADAGPHGKLNISFSLL